MVKIEKHVGKAATAKDGWDQKSLHLSSPIFSSPPNPTTPMSVQQNNSRARRGKRNSTKGENPIHTYSYLHERVLAAIGGAIDPAPWFHESGDGVALEEYSTNIMGSFQCNNERWYGVFFSMHPLPPFLEIRWQHLHLLTPPFIKAAKSVGAARSSRFTSEDTSTMDTTPRCSGNVVALARGWEV